MRIRHIVAHPDPRLRRISTEITHITDDVHTLAQDMLLTVRAEGGIGLAAPQVGSNTRLIVLDINYRQNDLDAPLFVLNPEILWTSEESKTLTEGCLSIKGQSCEVRRSSRVKVRFTDLDGQQHEREFSHLWAACIQHEIDHLNGVLIVDYVPADPENEEV